MAAGSIPVVSKKLPESPVDIKHNNSISKNDGKTGVPKPTTVESVRNIVDSVVNDVATTTKKREAARHVNESLADEKARIQSLINGLVKKVSDNTTTTTSSVAKADEPASTNTNSSNSNSSSPSKLVEGVNAAPNSTTTLQPGIRLDDHRTFYLEGTRLSWTQSSDSVTVYIAVPVWVRRSHVVIRMLNSAIAVRVAFAPTAEPVFETMQTLFGTIDPDSSMWMLDGSGESRNITLELEKSRVRWWSKLFTADDPAKYVAVPDKKTALRMYNSSNGIDEEIVAEEQTSISTSPPPPPPPAVGSAPNDGEAIPPPPDCPPPTLEEQPRKEKTIEDAAEETVAELAQAVCDATSITKRERRRVSFREPDEITPAVTSSSGAGPSSRRPPLSKPKVLTVNDVEEILEKNLAEVAKKGPRHATAALQVGMVYWHAPYGITKNSELAAKYLKYGLENGAYDANAAFQLGMMCNSGDGTVVNHEEAVRWWTLAAKLGNAVAMFNLGVMKMNGTGCDLDPIAALNLFAQAHTVNPRLRPPALPAEVISERIAMAQRIKKEKAKRNMSEEEKMARRSAAIDDLKIMAAGTTAVAGIVVALVAFRHWWKNTL